MLQTQKNTYSIYVLVAADDSVDIAVDATEIPVHRPGVLAPLGEIPGQ